MKKSRLKHKKVAHRIINTTHITRAILFFSILCISPCFALQKHSLEEKIGQLLMVHFHGEEANEDSRTLIQDLKVGSIIYYNWANGLTSKEQVLALSQSLQIQNKVNKNSLPLLIAIDQEGGIVSRLTHGFTQSPGNKALGDSEHLELTQQLAFITGSEMKTVGINMNLAPVIDVNSNPKNPIIGDRSFGKSAEKVAIFGERALLGYKQAGIISTLKHYPGHGDVTIDSHKGLPIVDKSIEQLEQVELLPFAALASKADAIMTAHILVPSLDPDHCSTLSQKTLFYLREQLGFRGVIISDSLTMKGVLEESKTVDEAAILALNAGCDLLILGGNSLIQEDLSNELSIENIRKIQQSILKAVQEGRISKERITESYDRICSLKQLFLLNP